MGRFVNDKNFNNFRDLYHLVFIRPKARRCCVLHRINASLTKHMAGNNSGALLLTVFGKSTGAANERFTRTRQVSAFCNGQINEACPKHPAFIERGRRPEYLGEFRRC